MTKKVKRGQVQSRSWWALVRSPKALPVLFASRKDALENADSDERIVRVDVCGSGYRYFALRDQREFQD